MSNIKISKNKQEIDKIIQKKIDYYKKLLKKSTKSFEYYKLLNLYNENKYNNSFVRIENIYTKCFDIQRKKTQDDKINLLQEINNDFFDLIKLYGTEKMEDVLIVCYGLKYIDLFKENEKYKLINEYFHPINFKLLTFTKENKKINNKTIYSNQDIVTYSNNLDCYDLGRTEEKYIYKLQGVRIVFKEEEEKKALIINGIIDNTFLQYGDNEYINTTYNSILYNQIKDNDKYDKEIYNNFIQSLTLKDILIYNKDEIYQRYKGFLNQLKLIKQKPISTVVSEFMNDTLYHKRNTLIQLLINKNNPEYQYLAYLLYDLLSSDETSDVDSKEQNLIYHYLPWNMKKLFKHAMKTTIEYTKKLSNFQVNNIPLEQQICLMKVDDYVKEKAMTKLKEVKSKTDDTGSKARQYLEGLLKIPFGYYKQEPVLNKMKECNQILKDIIQNNKLLKNNIEIKDKYTTTELKKYIRYMKDNYLNDTMLWNNIKDKLKKFKRDELVCSIISINKIIKKHKLKGGKLIHSGKRINFMIDEITKYIITNRNNKEFIKDVLETINIKNYDFVLLKENIYNIDNKWSDIKNNINKINNILDNAVHGHKEAKRNIERIIGQWMSGNQTGYCFGFEGPPGVGKTSLAKKGLAKCLTDEKNEPRPFGFIAIGGSSNGSLLNGHNYTYVGSTWGRIVDILIESKCMNPIIFIDELDKVSKTEHGKEIIGILTHLVDPTQNESFQDKYFSGIKIDLSKALFIFSYNDVNAIDKILLDRIHRIRFQNLTLEEKITITYDYILPEIYDKLNLHNSIVFTEDIIKYIIQNYTYESGVRKLKEILFEIIGEVNLEILKNDDFNCNKTMYITKEDIKNKYLKDRFKNQVKKIHTIDEIGVINGLWANSLGQGGIIPIQTNFFPTNTFLELKLTGLQGDIMKESMNVAKTLAYKMTNSTKLKRINKRFEDTKLQGIHIHCPEGATPKDGPSAGTAITISIYSLLNDLKIKHNIAITGEINLQGTITAIGGLDLKILGGIDAGIKTFIYPKENKRDFDVFYKKYREKDFLQGINFYAVSHINDVIKIVFNNTK